MQSIVVIYNDPQGYKEFRRVPHSLQPSDYDRGVFIGPPDVQVLGFNEEKTLALNNALVDAGFVDLKSMNGRRADLLQIVQRVLGLSSEEALQVRNHLLAIYTRDFYPEKFED